MNDFSRFLSNILTDSEFARELNNHLEEVKSNNTEYEVCLFAKKKGYRISSKEIAMGRIFLSAEREMDIDLTDIEMEKISGGVNLNREIYEKIPELIQEINKYNNIHNFLFCDIDRVN